MRGGGELFCLSLERLPHRVRIRRLSPATRACDGDGDLLLPTVRRSPATGHVCNPPAVAILPADAQLRLKTFTLALCVLDPRPVRLSHSLSGHWLVVGDSRGLAHRRSTASDGAKTAAPHSQCTRRLRVGPATIDPRPGDGRDERRGGIRAARWIAHGDSATRCGACDSTETVPCRHAGMPSQMGAHQPRVGPATIDPRPVTRAKVRAASERRVGQHRVALDRTRRWIALGDGRGVPCAITACDARHHSL